MWSLIWHLIVYIEKVLRIFLRKLRIVLWRINHGLVVDLRIMIWVWMVPKENTLRILLRKLTIILWMINFGIIIKKLIILAKIYLRILIGNL